MIPRCHLYNVRSKGNFSWHFIIFSLLYSAEYWVWNANTILKILTRNTTLPPTQNSVWLIYLFTISSHMTLVAQSISTGMFVGGRSVFDHTSQYQRKNTYMNDASVWIGTYIIFNHIVWDSL